MIDLHLLNLRQFVHSSNNKWIQSLNDDIEEDPEVWFSQNDGDSDFNNVCI